MKGADTVMAGMVQYNDWLEEECSNMAREGSFLSVIFYGMIFCLHILCRIAYFGSREESVVDGTTGRFREALSSSEDDGG